MPTSDAPALNPHGTLKDMSEIEWLNSPSDENCTVSLEDPKKRKRTNSEHDTDELPSALKEIVIFMVALCLSKLLQTSFGMIRTNARA